MTEETGVTVAETDDNEEEVITLEEEFKGLHRDLTGIKDKWNKLAKTKEEENHPSALVFKLLAGDLIPLIADALQATGEGFEEVGTAIQETADTAAGGNLSDDEASQVYLTLQANVNAFEAMAESATEPAAKDSLTKMVEMNKNAMEVLLDNFGEGLVEMADELRKEAEAE